MSVARRANAGAGWRWFACAASLYRTAPLTWLLMAAGFGAVMTVFAVMPLIGGILASLAGPVLSAGLLAGAADVSAGRPLRVRRLFFGLTDGAALPRLLGLGATVLAVNFTVFLVLLIWVAMSMMPMLMSASGGSGFSDAWLIGQLAGAAVFLFLVLTVYLLLACALLYGLPLVVFRASPVGAALRSSVGASLRNWLPWIVASLPLLAVLGLLIAAVAPPTYHSLVTDTASLTANPPSNPMALMGAFPMHLLLTPLLAGFVVQTLFTPLAMGVLYCSFRDVYGETGTLPED